MGFKLANSKNSPSLPHDLEKCGQVSFFLRNTSIVHGQQTPSMNINSKKDTNQGPLSTLPETNSLPIQIIPIFPGKYHQNGWLIFHGYVTFSAPNEISFQAPPPPPRNHQSESLGPTSRNKKLEHPKRLTWEPENTPLGKGTSKYSRPIIFRFYSNLPGCSQPSPSPESVQFFVRFVPGSLPGLPS